MLKFKDLPLHSTILETLIELGYETPTPVQAQAIPLILEGHDLLGIAETGTGKTAAFSLPIIQKLFLSEGKGLRALILAPTRELVCQIQENIELYSKNSNLSTLAIYGGVDQKPQVEALRRGVDILVATPGRLLDLINQEHVRLQKIEFLVLDEADRMLDMGFIEDIESILKLLPDTKQGLLFSATMPAIVKRLSEEVLNTPKKVEVKKAESSTPAITQRFYSVKREDKFQLLKKILKEEGRDLVVIFTLTKESADKVKEYLRHHKMASALIHGDRSQRDREQALQLFKEGSMTILVATDIAARGIDVPGISHVINFELPVVPETYIHRIGRTGRAGETGEAITFVDESEELRLEAIERLLKKKFDLKKFKGQPERGGLWLKEGSIRKVTPPTPGKSQDKTAYLDHSKRQKVVEGGPKVKDTHPGFRNKKKRRK